jgi:hypothetical protein
MNTPNTHTQLPENLIVVDRVKLEAKISEYLEKLKSSDTSKEWKSKYEAKLVEYHAIICNSFPLTPILEDAWEKSIDSALINWDIECREKDKQSYLSQPITLKKK